MKQITIITGATASGKTHYSLEYIKQFKKAIIINADASAIYRNFPILTARPEKMEGHYLFEICDITENFSVSKWLFKCEEILRLPELKDTHKVIVGGTCMYIFLLINGLIRSPAVLPEYRQEAERIYEKIGYDEFLKKVTSEDANTRTDKQRLINNYSMILQTGKSFIQWQKQPKHQFLKPDEFNLVKIIKPREEIYANCNLRFLQMLEIGVEAEVEKAMQKYGSNFDFKKILCANEIRDYKIGVIEREEMIRICQQRTRNLAKSQLTWVNNKL